MDLAFKVLSIDQLLLLSLALHATMCDLKTPEVFSVKHTANKYKIFFFNKDLT